MKTGLLLISLGLSLIAHAQEPVYTEKHFVTRLDTAEFKPLGPVKNGSVKTYIEAGTTIYDVDDNETTVVKGGINALIYLEGSMKNGKKDGVCRQYLIDSADHKKRYLINEQTYANDKLNGLWKVYNLKGTLARVMNYKNDSLNGMCREYWIDGKTILNEDEFFNGRNRFISREFKSGKITRATLVVNGVTSEVKEYYETGVLKEEFSVKNGMRDGLRIYYYPDGKPWIETIYKENKAWTVIVNYDSKGNKRNAGTLKDGNGTLILYDDDTTIRQTVTYKNGEAQK
jgi:antitoxin component YwqK of YwqJK toxin-antitoxin module